MAEVETGKVTHYFGHLGVAALQLTNGTLGVGDTVHIKGHTSDITAKVNSMEVNHMAIHDARVGDSIGEFKITKLNTERITLQWNDKTVDKSIDELLDRTVVAAAAPDAPRAAAPPPAPPRAWNRSPRSRRQSSFRKTGRPSGASKGPVLFRCLRRAWRGVLEPRNCNSRLIYKLRHEACLNH